MKKKLIVGLLSIVVAASLFGCSSKTKDSADKENKAIASDSSSKDDKVVDSSKVTNNSDSSTSKDKSSDASSTTGVGAEGVLSNGKAFPILTETEYADLQYQAGKYKEVDDAFALLKDYYLNGIDAVSSKLVSLTIDNDSNKNKAIPLEDKVKKDLDLKYQSMKNHITDKIVDVSVASYKYNKSGANDDGAIDIIFDITLKTDKGDAYSTMGYVSMINTDQSSKIMIRP